jgi:hypothetical protein
MPWTPDDAKRHKKGLTPKQARQWSKVANSALAACQDAGESDCEGRAIRQANSVVSKDMETADDLVLCLEARIAKTDDAQRRLFGWASIAVKKDGRPMLDLQGDVIEIADLEEAFYAYVKESGELNFVHRDDCRASLIEAIVFTPEKLAVLGLAPDALPLGAWVGFELDDTEEYQRVKESEYFMFSIEGSALREAF